VQLVLGRTSFYFSSLVFKKHAASIAKTLKRGEAATRQKAFSIGLSLDSRV
jgi:hypothetical protein